MRDYNWTAYLIMACLALAGCEEDLKKIEPKSKKVFMAFVSKSCVACKYDKEKLESLSVCRDPSWMTYTIDVVVAPGIAELFEITVVPTYIVTVDEEVVFRGSNLSKAVMAMQ